MGNRFIARVARHTETRTDSGAAFKESLAEQPNLAVLWDRAGLTVAVEDVRALRCGDHGIILGTLFRRGDLHALTELAPGEAAAIVESRGQHLIEAYWGPYIAFLQDAASGHTILRAPWGELPAYRYDRDEEVFIASDVGLLTAYAGYRPAIDWDAVLAHLAHGHVQHTTTCLKGIESLPGGERLCFTDHHETRDMLWSPWTYTAQARQTATADEATRLIRDTTLSSVGARASQFRQVLLTLSGGLDSSIVAACLKGAKASFSGITLVTRDPVGDERHYAGQTSAFLEFPFIASLRDVTRVEVGTSGAKGRPYPCVHGFLVESMRLAQEAADQSSAKVIFNGSGGDSVFCSLRSGAPAADRLLVEGWGRGFVRTVRDISLLAPASMVEVLRDALARAWFGKPAFRLRPQLDFLTREARARINAQPDHPWLPVPPKVLPGRARHAWMLAYSKAYVESLDPCSALPVVAPSSASPLSKPACPFRAGCGSTTVSIAWLPGRLSRAPAPRNSRPPFERNTQQLHLRNLRGPSRGHKIGTLGGTIGQRGTDRAGRHPADSRVPVPPDEGSVERILNFLDVEAWAASWLDSAR
jgi:asparagine synthase (glutamine-hydrolysing)